MYSDSGRFDHCWESNSATHAFLYPGVYDMKFHGLGPGNILIDSTDESRLITVIGSKADIDYELKCNDSYTINLNAESSTNADVFAWVLDDEVISRESSLSYTFDETGSYWIYLYTEDSSTDCAASVDSTEVFITDVFADFEIPDVVCANTPTALDASKSIDAHDSCYEGFLWEFETNRPREVGMPVLMHSFPPGKQTIKLTVEDINGCESVIEKSITAYDIVPEFELDSIFCLPYTTQILDGSIADTTLVSWEWSINDTDNNPTYTFTDIDIDTVIYLSPDSIAPVDGISVQLILTDALGCMDSIEHIATLYEPVSEITLDNGPKICIDEIINFTAEDFIEQGSFLNFEWDYQTGTSVEQNPEIIFTEAGDINVQLTFTEASTGCTNTIDTIINVFKEPIADFSTIEDSIICFGEQIEFTNTSFEDGPVLYSWDFGNGATSTLENPTIAYDKGTYTVQLIVRSFYGCRDTFEATYTLVGPEGTFTVDKTEICPGEEVTFTLLDTSGVQTYFWDFGDGSDPVYDQSPVSYTYSPLSNTTDFNPRLVLQSEDGGDCDVAQEIPIDLSGINAMFEVLLSDLCPGSVTLVNNSSGGTNFVWNVNGQEQDSNGSQIDVDLPIDTDSDVSLTVTDDRGCIDEYNELIGIDAADEIVRFPNVFTPNNDNHNDNFNVIIADPAQADRIQLKTFRVFNRWGNLVYDNNNQAGWNGSYDGKILEPDVFAFVIELSLEGCPDLVKKGNVTIVK